VASFFVRAFCLFMHCFQDDRCGVASSCIGWVVLSPWGLSLVDNLWIFISASMPVADSSRIIWVVLSPWGAARQEHSVCWGVAWWLPGRLAKSTGAGLTGEALPPVRC